MSDGSPQPGNRRHPATSLEDELCDLWCRMLGVPAVGLDDHFFSLGNSFQALRMIVAVHRELRLDISLQTVLENPTVRRLARQLRASAPALAGGCLIPLQRSGHPESVYCFHAVAGTLTRYAMLAAHLADRYDVQGLQAPGLRAGEEPLGTFEEMASAYLSAIHAAGESGPLMFVGYSLGGLIAYEAARQALASGLAVRPLILIDAVAKPTLDDDPGYAVRSLVRNALRLDLDADKLLDLAADERTEVIRRTAVASGVLPSDCDAVHIGRMLRMYDIVRDAARAYRIRPVPVDVVALRAVGSGAGVDLGWSRLARHVTVRDFAADHYDITGDVYAPLLADTIKAIFGPPTPMR